MNSIKCLKIILILSRCFMGNVKKIGNDGEKKVATALSTLPKDNFRLFNNVLIKTKSGTTQIDHPLVSTRGYLCNRNKSS